MSENSMNCSRIYFKGEIPAPLNRLRKRMQQLHLQIVFRVNALFANASRLCSCLFAHRGLLLRIRNADHFFTFRIESVNRAGQARVKRVNSAKHFQRFFRVRHGIAKQRRLVRPMRAVFVPRSCIPRRRHNRLIIRDLPFLDNHPVRQRAAWRFVKPTPWSSLSPNCGFTKIFVSPEAMLFTSRSQCFSARSASIEARMARAAMRPSVDCSITGVTCFFEIADTF